MPAQNHPTFGGTPEVSISSYVVSRNKVEGSEFYTEDSMRYLLRYCTRRKSIAEGLPAKMMDEEKAKHINALMEG